MSVPCPIPPSPLLPLIAEQLDELRGLCRTFGVVRLELFGSASKGRFDPASSDLDFIVRMTEQEKHGYSRRFYDFAEALEGLYGRPVDLLTDG
ncbi:nucleotidyltransferase domain-containing protein [Synechococcus sp. CS-1325]|uniref:nucleotidyltransferase family protein n=1 Tax=unclassified Synechococcus TaxID=2626047 RepID=UPI000DB550AE|nr:MULTISPECIES: nucleotidyltransferase domain-containing protein [unclassified Synechococcus]MCT0200540.1 nucleotidyltransferase domain-containing protein [Synechococcus sp. CS-1325]MCT0213481.1 nucleotidyltransferase domain-containing protein [Synechococcus sp. CS-1326]MCT0234638.1 nucleotidyltransferase domain-containing protein [Synechococcus sp. CS-1327]PZU96903.1 MAG: DNA polymerase subunit beta [Cyanobium sp.]